MYTMYSYLLNRQCIGISPFSKWFYIGLFTGVIGTFAYVCLYSCVFLCWSIHFTCWQGPSCAWQTGNTTCLCAECNSKVVLMERLQSFHYINRLWRWPHPMQDLKKRETKSVMTLKSLIKGKQSYAIKGGGGSIF